MKQHRPSGPPKQGSYANVIAFCLLPALGLVVGSSSAGFAKGGVEGARRLHAAGTILSLEHFITRAQGIVPGKIIGAELIYEDSHEAHVYEIEILDSQGQVWELEFEAETGELIEHQRGVD